MVSRRPALPMRLLSLLIWYKYCRIRQFYLRKVSHVAQNAAIPRARSPAEQSFLQRRCNVLRTIRDRNLSPAAKQVMVHFSLLTDDPFILAERPDVPALARRLVPAERTVRQAIAELVEQGCLTFRQTGDPHRLVNRRRPTRRAARISSGSAPS